jgi:hypothetical protein
MNKLAQAFKNPTQKFCYYSGNANPVAAKILGVDKWDWTPQRSVNIEPYYWNTHTLALAFGCKKMFTSEGKEWIIPVITDPAMIKDIEIPDVRKGRTGEILEIAERLLSENDKDTLIRLPDIQSPLGVAELIMGEQLYFSLITNPTELHELLIKITEFTILYVKEFRKVLGDRINPACHPQIWCDPEGYYISDDANSMVSPEMHKEFSVDYINRITDELGPVIYHTCTWTEPYMENIRKIKNKKVINWSIGTSRDPAELIMENAGKSIIAPHIGLGMHLENGITSLNKDISSEAELVKYFLDSMTENSTLYLRFEDSLYEKPEIIKDIYYILKDRGYATSVRLNKKYVKNL